MSFQIDAIGDEDRAWVASTVAERWGSGIVLSRGTIYQPRHLPGFIARRKGLPVGHLTYHLDRDSCEIVTLDSLREGKGVGSALIEAAVGAARAAGCRRLWLITTNDNLHALRFYQRRGFRLAALHPDAVTAARRIKPEIPLVGHDDIPIRDEIELEMLLDEEPTSA